MNFLEAAGNLQDRLVRWRRDIHRCPELSFFEDGTAGLVADALEEMGLEVQRRVAGGAGVVGLLPGQDSGAVAALRADLDALPLQEKTGLAFASQVPGVMHACGHDAHVAVVLGAAAVLSRLPVNQRRGSVKFIFQPAEEVLPGGARSLIEAGVLQNPTVNAVFGLHVHPGLPTGVLGWREGVVMASADNFELRILGESGHGAAPQLAKDAVLAAAAVVQALQAVVSRRTDPLEPVVLTIGTICGGQAANIIAGEVRLTGTVRTLAPGLRQVIPQFLEEAACGSAAAHGASCTLSYEWGYPPLQNNSRLIHLLRDSASEVLGELRCLHLVRPSMGGEDFAYYAERVPAAYFFLGTGGRSECSFPWHHPRFDVDEAALVPGVAVLAAAVARFWGTSNDSQED